ncbi:MAG: hypothetical protein FWE58_01245 [Methanobrevibacter sp.]|nr:hypothetical protein [Methanobrevibacter sp.]
MSGKLKILLILVFFIAFFEAGLFSSYTIITSEPPDVRGLIDLQIRTITEFFSPEKISEVMIKDPEEVTIINKAKVADAMASAAKVDGIDISTMNVTTLNNTQNREFDVEINALAFSSPNSTKGSLILSTVPDYSVTVKALAYRTNDGTIEVNVTSIAVVSIMKLATTDETFIGGGNSSNRSGSSGNNRGGGLNISFV